MGTLAVYVAKCDSVGLEPKTFLTLNAEFIFPQRHKCHYVFIS